MMKKAKKKKGPLEQLDQIEKQGMPERNKKAPMQEKTKSKESTRKP